MLYVTVSLHILFTLASMRLGECFLLSLEQLIMSCSQQLIRLLKVIVFDVFLCRVRLIVESQRLSGAFHS